ncbi:small GTPase [Naegleria gruberi]|uniref:Small GTPase n=1 Tax=Naegleria gruberi TaxID=5762 RepID=D2VE97_NAEGR|nr:small GTPase [Naegleria gruberi]EFC44758.1 small GTPase [Naegleria gruberi]|eukprot:XP_002677502.1 small GTPase [Naegleria gruberi]
MRKLASFLGGGKSSSSNGSSSSPSASGTSNERVSSNKQQGSLSIVTTSSIGVAVGDSSSSPSSNNNNNGSKTPRSNFSRSTSNTKINSSSSSSLERNNIEQEIQNIIFNTSQINTLSKVPNVQPEYYLKIVVLGGPSVGKSAIINRYLKNKDHPALSVTKSGLYIPTIGVDMYSKPVKKYRDASITKCKSIQFPVRLTILDVPHSEFMKQSVSKYFENAHGIVLAFDVTNIKSISAIDQWRSKIPSHLLTSTVLLAHKAELKPHIITPNSLDNYVRDSGLLAWFSTSIRNFQSINGAFQYLVDRSLSKLIKKYQGLPTLNHQMNAVSMARKSSSIPLAESKSDNLAESLQYSNSVESNSDTGSISKDDSKQIVEGFSTLYDMLEDKNPNLTMEFIEKFRSEITSFYFQLSSRFKEFKVVCQSCDTSSNDQKLMDLLINECDAERIILLNKLALVEKELVKCNSIYTENNTPMKNLTKLYIELKREFYIVKIEKWISFWYSLKSRFCLSQIFYKDTKQDCQQLPEISESLYSQPINQNIVAKLESRRAKIEKLKQHSKIQSKEISQKEDENLVESDSTFSVINQIFKAEMYVDIFPQLTELNKLNK